MFWLLENIYIYIRIYIYTYIWKNDHPSRPSPKKKTRRFSHFFGLRFRRGLRQHFLAAAKVFETPQFAELRLGNRLVLWHSGDRCWRINKDHTYYTCDWTGYPKISQDCVCLWETQWWRKFIFLEVPRHCQTETYNIENLQLRRAVGLSSQPGFFPER